MVIGHAAEASERRFLCAVFLLALLLRAAVAVGTYLALPYGFFTPDEVGYTHFGAQLAGSSLGSPLDAVRRVEVWLYLNAVAISVVGSGAELLIRLVNCAVGSLVPVLCYKLAARIGTTGTARLAAMLTAGFPSIVLWSSLNLKDAEAHVLVLGVLLLALRLQRRLTARDAIAIALMVAVASTLRWYLLLPLGGGVLLAQLVAGRRASARLAFAGAGASLLAAGMLLGVPRAASWYLLTADLGTLTTLRSGFVYGAQSAFLAAPQVHTPLELVRFIPVGLAYFLLGPFPWVSGSVLQELTAPEMLVYYSLIPFTGLGIREALATRAAAALPPLAFAGLLAVAYSTTIANFGTVFRLRDQLMVVMLCFAAIGLRRYVTRSTGGGQARPATAAAGGRS